MAVIGSAAAHTAPVVLVVGFSDSPHTARWLNMLLGRGLQFVLLPVYEVDLANQYKGVRKISTADDLAECSDQQVAVFDVSSVPSEELETIESSIQYEPWRPAWMTGTATRPGHLVAAIRRLRPVLVHSMVIQFGGYLTLGARQYLRDEFPIWLLSNWGSDVFLFRKLAEHQKRIGNIVSLIDAYHSECERDVVLIKQMGFRGFTFPSLPATGGVEFQAYPSLEKLSRPSGRREILIKGYHGWSGRALHVLAAVHLAARALRQFRIRVTLAGAAVREMARALADQDRLDIVIEPFLPDHMEALIRLGHARAVIGLGISDGISTTLLEAMTVGTFPIQGSCSCGDEWIVQQETGILVSPHDVRALAHAIERAATDDELVDAAALRNRETVEKRWNAATNGEIAIGHYKSLIQSLGASPALRRGSAGINHV